jgi:AcrR family transcriptional regulator
MSALMMEPDIPAGLRERKKKETRDRIVLAAFDLFQSRGYDETTLSQIADRAQVAVRTVSNYFPQKVDLLVAYRQNMLTVFQDTLRRTRSQDPLRRVRSALIAGARENQRHPNGHLAQRLLARHGSYRALARIQDQFRADLLEVVSTAELRPGVDRQLAVLVLAAGHLAVIQRWAGGEGPSLTTSVERMFDLWVQGVAPGIVG